MTDYTKTTNFAAKDSLPSGDANKIVKGTEIDTEFNNIATASATKANIASPTFTGTVTIPTADINGGAVDATTIGASSASSIVGTTIVANTSINIAGDGATVTGIKDEDDMSSNSATKLATQQSIKAYVDSQVTAQDLDVTDGSSSIDIDLDSESLGILGGTGLSSTASGTSVTLAIDSTVATLTGSQTLTNKTLTAPTLTGTAVVASLDISGDVDVDGTLETDALSINGTTVTSTAAELNILDGVTSTAAELNILDGVTSTTAELNILDGVTSTAAELNILDGKAFLDEDNMASNSATGIASQQSIKAYVDSQVTAQDLDVTDGSTSIDIDLDSESLGILGGTGIDSAASGTGVTLSIDSTVATLTGTQTLTNKTLTAPTLTGTAVVASLDISGDVDVDGTLETDALSINGTAVTSTAAELNILDGVTATTAELNYVDGVTSAIQTQIDAKAPIANPTFTGSFTSPGIDDNADAIAITIDSSENVGIGASSPSAKLDVSEANAKSATGAWQILSFDETSQATGIGGGITFGGYKIAQSSAEYFAAIDAYKENSTAGNAAGSLRFHTQVSVGSGLVERMRIDSSGNVSVGHSSAGGSKFAISDSGNATIQFFPEISTDTNLTQHYDLTAAAYMNAETRAASHSFKIGTAEKVSIDASGNVLVGTTDTSLFNNTSDGGIALMGSNRLDVARAGDVVSTFNRMTDDGSIIQFYAQGALEGSIDVSGNTVSLVGFSGAHASSGIDVTTAKGTVVSTIDQEHKNSHAKIKVSDSEGDARVYGVVDRISEEGDIIVSGVGIGEVKVTGACAGGDLLESNGDGTAKVQSDDIIRSKTIGKVTIGNGDEGVKLVSCVLYCG